MRPGGVAFSTLLSGSLPELNQAWQAIDERPHANRFLSEQAVRQALAERRASGRVHAITLLFPDALGAMRSLKALAQPICTTDAALRRSAAASCGGSSSPGRSSRASAR